MTIEEYKRMLKSCGKQFYIDNYDLLKGWTRDKSELIDRVFELGYDSNRNGSSVRVNTAIKIIGSEFELEPFK